VLVTVSEAESLGADVSVGVAGVFASEEIGAEADSDGVAVIDATNVGDAVNVGIFVGVGLSRLLTAGPSRLTEPGAP
jgi:hypothetical protein